MAISQRLDLRQSQSLVMTPQLQQAIKLLQLSNIELTEFVEDELSQNPMLERDDGEAREREQGDGPTADDAAKAGDDEFDGPDSMDMTAGGDLPSSDNKPLDLDYENVWDDQHPRDVSDELRSGFEASPPVGAGGRSDFSESLGDFESTLSDEPSLREYLTEQLTLDIKDPAERIIGVHLIDMLDESGWLVGTTLDVSDLLGCENERVQAVLERLQQFDPPGVFARGLKECLALQLRDLGRLDPAMEKLIENLER